MAEVVNIKNGPELALTYVVGHDVTGKGGRQTVGSLLNFGAVGGAPGPVIAQGKIVYGNNEGGQYSPVAYNEVPAAFALVMRDFSGNFTVNAPTADTQPATKKYVDDKAVAIGGQAPAAPLVLGTTTAQAVQIITDGNPRITIDAIGNVGIGVENPEVPFIVGGGMWTFAGPVEVQINPDSGTNVLIGTISNHPVELQSNGATRLTLDTAGQLLAAAGYAPNAALSLATKGYADGLDAANVKLTGNQTVAGIKTFSSSPVLPAAAPTTANQATPKSYVDGRLSAAQRTALNALAVIATADAIDPATTMALANECKAKINAIISALQAA